MNDNRADLNWMIDELVNGVPGVRFALVLSGDGLLIQRSTSLTKDAADQLAAYASSLYSVAKGPGQMFGGGPVRQAMVEYQDGYLFVMAAGQNAYLAVFAADDVDLGMISYEMNRLVRRVGDNMRSEARTAADGGVRA